MKHTKGECKVITHNRVKFIINNDNVLICELDDLHTIGFNQPTGETTEANAKLIAEAFNVTNETGFTPRQIAEQKAKLLKACKLASKMYKDVQPSGGWQFVDDSLTDAIQKATP